MAPGALALSIHAESKSNEQSGGSSAFPVLLNHHTPRHRHPRLGDSSPLVGPPMAFQCEW